MLPEIQGFWLDLADAALSALAKPTEAMLDAGEDADISVRDAWDAMIGAAGEG